MTWDARHLSGLRRDALARLRARRGLPRRTADDEAKQHTENIGAYLAAFLSSAAGGAAGADGPAVSDAQMHDLLDRLQEDRRGGPHPLEPRPDGQPAPELPAARRRQLIEEIATAHFRTNLHDWLGSVKPDHELTSTPAAELRRLQTEARYRLQVLKTMQELTEREIDLLETHLRALAARAAGAGGAA